MELIVILFIGLVLLQLGILAFEVLLTLFFFLNNKK